MHVGSFRVFLSYTLTFEKFLNLNFAYNNFDILKNQMKIFPNHSIQIVLLNIQKKKSSHSVFDL